VNPGATGVLADFFNAVNPSGIPGLDTVSDPCRQGDGNGNQPMDRAGQLNIKRN
jgi:hypothetical protein